MPTDLLDTTRSDSTEKVACRIQAQPPHWFGVAIDLTRLIRFGFKTCGGGPHQSKTMMLSELSALLDAGYGEAPAVPVLEQNLLGKPSVRARRAALYRLQQLYGVGGDTAICLVLRRLWPADPDARPFLALLCALARDPLLRDGATAVLDATLGEQVRWPKIATAFESRNPGRLGNKMARSLAQNAASSWTQAGLLKGKQRKERIRAKSSPIAAAYATLLASLCGFGGRRLLESPWMAVLDRPIEERLALLRQAEGLGLMRVRSAGDVLEIEIRRHLTEALGVSGLVNG